MISGKSIKILTGNRTIEDLQKIISANRRLFDWDKVEAFYYVAVCKSYTRAGQELNISQSSLSRQVSALEDQLKRKLFIRRSKGVEFTEEGRNLFDFAQNVFFDMQAYKAELNNDTLEVKGKIKISTTHAISDYILTDQLIEFSEIYPDIRFEVVCSDHLIDLIINQVDVAIRPYDDDNKNVIQEHLFTLETGIYGSQKYIEKHGEPSRAEELDNHRLIVLAHPEDTPYADTEWLLKVGTKHGKRKPYFTTTSAETGYCMAGSGKGLAKAYDLMNVIERQKLKRILPDLKGPHYDQYIIYAKQAVKVRKIEAFKNFLLKKFSQNR